MCSFLPTIILRHRKENLKKCSLRGLENRPDMRFFTYPKDSLPDLTNYFLLDLNAPLLTKNDKDLGIFLIDGTWSYAQTMAKIVPDSIIKRSLPPHIQTAYPRRQTACKDPSRGLASIEALFVAYTLLERNPKDLLDHYHWKLEFLSQTL